MNDTLDIGKMLSDKLKAKATELSAASGSLGLQEWALKYIPHFFTRGMCELHNKLCEIGDELKVKRGKKTLVIAPRGNAKSTWVSLALPLKAICEGTERYIILCADTAGQAEAYLKSISMELESNDAIRQDYPLACQKGETWNTGRKETANNVCIEALGKGNNVRGRKFRQYRPTLIIVDDPQNDEDILSPNTRQKDIEWFDKALVPAGDTGTNYFVVGTMLHRDCIVGALASRSDFEIVKFSSVIKWPTHFDTLWQEWKKYYHSDRVKCTEFYETNKELMNEGVHVLWPEKEDILALMEMRENIGEQAFASEKQNDPRDPSKCEFPEEWFEGLMYDDPPKYSKIVSVGYLDPAMGGDTKRHDYPAIITLHYLPEYNYCLVEVQMKKKPVNQIVDDMIAWHKQVKYSAFGIEGISFQTLIYEELIAKAPMFPATTVENTGQHKNTRISRLGIWLQRKFFRFKLHCPDTKILLQQLKDHPHSDHDDGPDALEGALRVLTMLIDPSNDDTEMDAMDDGLGDRMVFV